MNVHCVVARVVTCHPVFVTVAVSHLLKLSECNIFGGEVKIRIYKTVILPVIL
jgi:hypothetical protein